MDEKEKLQTLTKEYDRVSSDIRAIETMNDKVIGFGLTIMGAGFAYGIQQKILPVFFFIPVGLIAVFMYATLQYHNVFWLGGYKRAIEDKINALADDTLVAWESLIETRKGRTNWANGALLSAYVLFLISGTVYCMYRIFAESDPTIGWTYGTVVLAALALLFVAVGDTMRISARSYAASRDLLGLSSPLLGDETPPAPAEEAP